MTNNEQPNPSGAVFVSGATGGLGRNVARELAANGRHVVVAGRRPDAVEAVVDEIVSSGGSASVFVADLADLDDLNRTIDQALENDELPPLHGIVANAGISTTDTLTTSAQGFDLTFGVNVLAHQLLLHRLSPHLMQGCRIVIVSSGVHHPGNKLARRLRIPLPTWVGTEKLAFQQAQTGSDFITDGPGRYSTSKLANVYQARELQRRLDAVGLDPEVFALDPGLMVDTDLARDAPALARFLLRLVGRAVTPFVDNMRLSADTASMVRELLDSHRFVDVGFEYIDDGHPEPLASLALDDDNAAELWETASRLVEASPKESVLLG